MLPVALQRMVAATALLAALFATKAGAQADDRSVLFAEAFDAYARNANPDGWVDTAVGRPGPAAAGLFKTDADPLSRQGAPNVVYGTRASAGGPVANARRAGMFSTLLSHAFDARDGFELTGRVLRMNGDGLAGLAVLSHYPDRDAYYLVGMDGEGHVGAFAWEPGRSGRKRPVVPDRQGLVPLDGTAPVDEPFTPGKWHRFRIRVAETGGSTVVAATFWPADEVGPASFEIRASDDSAGRLRAGRIALWSGERGDVWFDDIEVRTLAPVSAGGPPTISIFESGRAMVDGILVNRDLTPVIEVTDDFDPAPAVVVTLDGAAWRSGSVVSGEGRHVLRVVATDATGQSSARELSFEIDKTPPVLAVTSHVEGQLLASPGVVISGTVTGADWARVDGLECVVDPAAGSWTSPPRTLLEGANAVTVVAGDRAGNTSTIRRTLLLDTRGPALVVSSPSNGACLNLSSFTIAGTARDERLASVRVRLSGSSGEETTRSATLGPDGAWSVDVPDAPEGLLGVMIDAVDAAGHATTARIGVRIDRTRPVVEVTEGGSPFSAPLVNRTLALFVRAVDADSSAALTATLDGARYAPGSAIESEGAHVLELSAVDCAGNVATRALAFRIDKRAPALRDLVPENGGSVGTRPDSISGACDDAVRVELVGTTLVATPSNGRFTLTGVPFEEGTNRFTLRATDEAGNASELAYELTTSTLVPTVEILESGLPIAGGTIFNRAITPEIRSNAASASISATLNGAPFDPGSPIAVDGAYTLAASATDALQHVGRSSVGFTIDRTAPAVAIASPADGASIASDSVTVTGTSVDATSVVVHGRTAELSAGRFSAVVALEPGENVIVASGRDDAGNHGRAEVSVTRQGAAPAIVLLHPADKTLTNRPATELIGRVISPASVEAVTIAVAGQTKASLRVDPSGDFRTTLELAEGMNLLSATSVGLNGSRATASVEVVADFTPPSVTILANGRELRDGERIGEPAPLTLDVSDERTPAPSVTVSLDGDAVALPAIAQRGAHVVVASARDAAGNETRLERMFSVGGSGTASCAITRIDPDPAKPVVIFGTSTRICGRTGAEAVRVGALEVPVVEGSFCAEVQLPREGENRIDLSCVVDGKPAGTPVTMTLTRATQLPTVAIESPAEGEVLTRETIEVRGSVGPGVTAVSVNGVEGTFSTADPTVTRSFAAAGVKIAHGQNLLAVRAETASARIATTTRRVIGAIRHGAIVITSPIGSTPTGAASIDVSGTWSDVDPSTISASSGTVSTSRTSHTNGNFVVRGAALAIGPNAITISGRDAAGRESEAQVAVTRGEGAPSIRLDSPANGTLLSAGASGVIAVSGSFTAADGARVEVNGIAAALSGATFVAEVPLSSTPGAPTPIVARVTELDGDSAVASVRVAKLSGPFEVRKVDGAPSIFPADGAVHVPVSAQILVLLSHPVDQSSLAEGIVVETAAGQRVDGSLFADREVVAFAPAVPLVQGATYVVRVRPPLANGAGEVAAVETMSRFTTEFGSPSSSPAIDALPASVCGESLTVSGTAASGARVRIDFDGVPRHVTADGAGRFSAALPLAGPSGYRVLRVRAVGAEGALSPAFEACVLVACDSGPSVVSAAYDRDANRVDIVFSSSVDPATVRVGESVSLVTGDNRAVGGTVAVDGQRATVHPSENLAAASFTLAVTTGVRDVSGRPLTAPFAQSFFPGGASGSPSPGFGYVTGEVYEAATGRPLGGATVAVGGLLTTSDLRGRYTIFVPEGAHTIEVSATDHAKVWRQVIVPAGSGVVPIDIRLEARGAAKVVSSGDLTLTDGVAAALATPVSLTVAAGSLATGSSVTLTSISAQALAGLLPLGWSPLASAEVVAGNDADSSLTATLAFTIGGAAVRDAIQSLTAVRYDAARDEWTVIAPSVVPSGNVATVTILRSGAYALVYPDKGSGVAMPPPPVAGLPLAAVVDPCLAPEACGPLTKESFTLDPPVVMPDQRATATLQVDAALDAGSPSRFPSGTAVQAYIDEELTLSDGSTITDPPFATDLILYRQLDGSPAVATFHLAPSKRAAEVFLQVGWEHIRIHPYPGRLDRGTLIGNEGGRVPGDGSVTVDIPAGATPEPVRAEVHPIADLAAFGTINGFTVLSAFELELNRATQPASSDLDGDGNTDPIAPVELFKSATATFNIPSNEIRQLILAEVVDASSYGRVFRLVSMMGTLAAGKGSIARVSTQSREGLPLDGIVREGRYLLLAANQQIAYATGLVRLGSATGPVASDARVAALDAQGSPLGVVSVTRATGIYATPMIASAPVLRPESRTLGQGTPYTHAAAVAASSTLPVDLILAPQAPTVVSTTPANGAIEVSLTTSVQVVFNANIDPTSITAESITLVNALTGATVPGATQLPQSATSLLNWNLAKDAGGVILPLKPNARYTARVAPTVRAANGASLGATHTFNFATITQIISTDVNRDRIRITIPDANGVSQILGTAGAIPSGWTAVPVRRVRDFTTRYQTTAATDGSFSITIGTASGDAVSTTDTIDLQLVNTAGILAGIIRLTPFVTADNRGFLAPPDLESRFTSADNITVIVPVGAFDTPTLVTVAPARREDFSAVPPYDADLNFLSGVQLDFPGLANKRLELEIPVPAAYSDPTHQPVLMYLGDSTRGPRFMAVDTLRVDGGKLTTREYPSGSSVAKARGTASSPNSIITSNDVKKKLMGPRISGKYSYVDYLVNPYWAAVDLSRAVDQQLELFINAIPYLFVDRVYIETAAGQVTFPVRQDQAFTLFGVDASTGLEAFSKFYEAPPVTDPNIPINLPTPNPDLAGPYPVFGTPYKVEVAELTAAELSAGDFNLRLRGATLTISNKPSAKLPATLNVQVLNASTGFVSDPAEVTAAGNVSIDLPALARHKIIIVASRAEIDPRNSISVVFSETLFLGPGPVWPAIDEDAYNVYLRGKIKLEHYPHPLPVTSGLAWADVTPQVRFLVDSNGRRVTLTVPSTLLAAGQYRLTLSQELTDIGGNKLGTVMKPNPENPTGDPVAQGGKKDVVAEFIVRGPAGKITSFEIKPSDVYSGGGIRDLARYQNLTFVSALDGGILAYDMSDPLTLSGTVSPMSFVPGKWLADPTNPDAGYLTAGFEQHWAIAADHHGRIYSTGFTPLFGAMRSYRAEDFLKAAEPDTKVCDEPMAYPDHSVCKFHGAGVLSWRPGTTSSLPLSSSTFISDRAEATPRKMQVLAQDDISPAVEYFSPALFAQVMNTASELGGITSVAETTAPVTYVGGFDEFTVTVAYRPNVLKPHYLTRRVTIENSTLDMRWSADVPANGNAMITGVVARPGDTLRILSNSITYGVVALFGYGVAVYDLNGMESNDAAVKPADYKPFKEQLLLTNGVRGDKCGGPRLPANAIGDLTFTADTAIRTFESSKIQMYAVEVTKGIVDIAIDALQTDDQHDDPNLCPDRGASVVFKNRDVAYIDPRLSYIDGKFGSGGAFARFTQAEPFRWQITGVNNTKGERGSEAGTSVTRTYLLVPGGEFGLLVVESGGDPAPRNFSSYVPLTSQNLADVIWFPAGAVSVRTIPNTQFAAVADSKGRLNLVDLSRLDERWNSRGEPIPHDQLFPSALRAIDTPSAESDEVGVDDARIIWKSARGVITGTLPPLVDAEMGFALTGEILGKAMNVSSVFDPRIQVKAEVGPGTLREIGGVIPFGVDPPEEIKKSLTGPRASLGVFRFEVTLPGSVAKSMPGGKLRMAVESEVIPGSVTLQTPDILPRAHLRNANREGTTDARPTDFILQRQIPRSADAAANAALEKRFKHQRGFNRFVSPWVVAIADPRAGTRYEWVGGATSAQKRAKGCINCERPSGLIGLTDADGYYELWSAGRSLAVRAEMTSGTNPFAGTPYAYLGEQGRLELHLPSVMADTVHPADMIVAAQNPPVADGDFQETTYLHSGELGTAAVDLAVEGRGGTDIEFGRAYRSRSLGVSPLGLGWDSGIFKRLRALPSGNVEYRDGSGEVWTFTPLTGDAAKAAEISVEEMLLGGTVRYTSPAGLFLKLVRNATGFVLFDQQWHMSTFDTLGRLASESDEFFDPVKDRIGVPTGNVIRYYYDETGRLAKIADPVSRETLLSYWTEAEAASNTRAYAGLLKEIRDWRERSVRFDYDLSRRALLSRVALPDVAGVTPEVSYTAANRPTIEYGYSNIPPPPANKVTASKEYTDYLEYAANLTSIKDPSEVAKGSTGKARVIFAYEPNDSPQLWKRDRVFGQGWATGETTTITAEQFDGTMVRRVVTEDALKQKRTYDLGVDDDQRVHVTELRVEGVPVIGQDWPLDPDAADPAETAKTVTLTRRFDYDAHGLYRRVTRNDGSGISFAFAGANGGAPGTILEAMNDGIETMVEFGEGRSANMPVRIKREHPARPGVIEVREVETPNAENLVAKSNDVDIESSVEFSALGQVVGKTVNLPGGEAARKTTFDYGKDDSDLLVERGRVTVTKRGENLVESTTSYAAISGGGLAVTDENRVRGTTTRTEYDSMGRVARVLVKDPTGTLSDEKFGYSADGQLTYKEAKQGSRRVITRTEYDVMGRVIGTSMTGANVLGAEQELVARTTYDSASRLSVQYDPAPAGSTSTASVKTVTDGLGRVASVERVSGDGALKLETRYGYNLNGELAYESNGTVATAQIFDRRGQLQRSVDHEGLAVEYTWDTWDQLTGIRQLSKKVEGTRTEAGEALSTYTRLGRLRQTAEEISNGGAARATRFGWDDGGRRVGSRVAALDSLGSLNPAGAYRVEERLVDEAGRVLEERVGEASGISAPVESATAWSLRKYGYRSELPNVVTTEEPRGGGQASVVKTDYDGLGRPHEIVDAETFRTRVEYDELGNVTSMTAPGFDAAETTTYDSRGLPLVTTLANGKTVSRTYDTLGVLRSYSDEKGATTSYETDGLGRVRLIRYPDETTEEVRYEAATGRLLASRDRKGIWTRLEYDAGGRVSKLFLAGDGNEPDAGGRLIRKLEYDAAGRLTKVITDDAAIEYEVYDGLGRPSVTRTVRYAKAEVSPGVLRGTGLANTPEILDQHTQGHVWSVFDGERARWRMPAAGATLPETEPPSEWRRWIAESYDAGGNLVGQRAVASRSGPEAGPEITRADGRGIGRLLSRERVVSTEASVRQEYSYADGSTDPENPEAPVPAVSGLLIGLKNALEDVTLGGTKTEYDNGRRILGAADLGLGGRRSEWTYDRTTGRVDDAALMALAGGAESVPWSEATFTEPDFRSARTVTGRLTEPQRETLGTEVQTIEPPSWAAAPVAAYEVDSLTRSWGSAGNETRDFAHEAGRRTSDGVWTSSYDDEGRRVAIESGDRRIEYTYDPNGRIVGRAAQQKSGESWVAENRATVLGRDGLPANTTFVWDPIADRLVAVFETGHSNDGDANAGLVRQYVHGDQGYDDPVEVLRCGNPTAPCTTPVRSLPLTDEAATGSLQAVLSADGTLLERVLYADAWGDAPRYLQGPVADRMRVRIEKDGSGKLAELRVSVHLSESIRAESLAAGVELLVRTGESVVRSPVAAELDSKDPYTLLWKLNIEEWAALAGDGSGVVEIAVKDALRAKGWGETPVMPVPAWLEKISSVRAEAGRPVVKREQLAQFAAMIEAVPAGRDKETTIFEIADLYLVAAKESKTRLLTDFHVLPFREPADGSIFARARWYDASTGTFLTPDPLGYTDSSNLYAFAMGDPVNRRDPMGTTSSFFSDVKEAWTDYSSLPEEDKLDFRRSVSGMVGTIPVVGDALDVFQAATGYDPVAGEELSPGDRAIVMGAAALPLLSASVARNGVNATLDVLRAEERILETAVQTPKKYSVAELRRMIDEDLATGKYTKAEAIERIRAGKKCFVAGTLITTIEGLKPIEEIRANRDIVLSRNMETGQLEWQPVVQTFVREADEIVWISIEGEPNSIGTTPEHPFWVRRARDSIGDDEGGDDKGEWLGAGDLRKRDLLLSATGGWVAVKEVRRVKGITGVYNFEVSGNHNYHAGDVLVHNSDCGGGGVQANLVRGTASEETARQIARHLGETVIDVHFRRGAVNAGFDFLSFSGTGREARLFINEVKDEAGRVGRRRFTTLGFGGRQRNSMQAFEKARNVALQRIKELDVDELTKQALEDQLTNHAARIRLIGGRATVFDPRIMGEMGVRTRFLVEEGFRLP